MIRALHDLPALPRDHEGPVFNEPWEAQAFALAMNLLEARRFSWQEWTAALTREIKAAQECGDPDLGHTYYHHWLNALERLCAAKAIVAAVDMQTRKEEWRRAYVHTPHGQPVELSAARLTLNIPVAEKWFAWLALLDDSCQLFSLESQSPDISSFLPRLSETAHRKMVGTTVRFVPIIRILRTKMSLCSRIRVISMIRGELMGNKWRRCDSEAKVQAWPNGNVLSIPLSGWRWH